MGFFTFESAESKMKSRIGPVKALSEKLDADYYHGIETVRNTFFPDIKDDLKDSNVIVGESEGYRYCFLEYYHQGRGKNDHSKWVSKISLRLNEENFPDFDLQTKKSALASAGCILAFALPFGAVPVFMFLNFIFIFLVGGGSKSVPKEGILIPIIMGLGFLLFAAVFGTVAYLMLSTAIDTYKQVKNQGKYCISNPQFREKYVIMTKTDANRIRKVFNEKVCSRIVSYRPELESINIKDNCIHRECDYNQQLSYPLCLKYINMLVKEAQLFEKDETDYYSSF